jgi:3-isopropylmalate dehydrogenase
MNHKIAVIPGDGIGPEVTAQAMKVLDAAGEGFGFALQYRHALMGACAIDAVGDPLPEDTIEACLDSDAVLFGAIGHPKYDNDPSAKLRPEQGLLRLRKTLGLFANIRPISTYPTLAALSPLRPERLENVDFVMYRELTGGIYFGKKTLDEATQTASDECRYSHAEIARIAHLAFRHAQLRRKKLTLVDKANVLETSRLWRKSVQAIAPEYPDVAVDFLFVDNAAMQIITQPAQFDVLLTENMFGDILSDEASVISGSLGMLPSASIGEKTALFEPIHGSYPQAAGKDIANPLGAILSAAMLLDHLRQHEAAQAVREAVQHTLEQGIVTTDLNPNRHYRCSEVGDAVGERVRGEKVRR